MAFLAVLGAGVESVTNFYNFPLDRPKFLLYSRAHVNIDIIYIIYNIYLYIIFIYYINIIYKYNILKENI